MTHAYDDIIGLPHHQSVFHKPMSLHDRAAQFSPFAALTGYDDEVTEAGRLTSGRIQLEENDLAVLDRKLERLITAMQAPPGSSPEVHLTRFRPDAKKEGGSYETVTGRLRRIDLTQRLLIFTDRREIPLDQITDMDIPGENCTGEESLL